MKPFLPRFFSAMLLLALAATAVFGQSSSATSSLSGVVLDPSGAVIPGADVNARNDAMGEEFKAVTADNGTFFIPSLPPGVYTVSVMLTGFKQAVVKDVNLYTGVTRTVRVTLEMGEISETVVVTGGGEILQSHSANIATTINVNQIANLPLVSRNPLNFVVLLPGVNTARGNRDSTINGLPSSAIDITLDGINIQDNFNKTSDGFFTRVPVSLDSVQEVTVSTATPEAQGGGMGAVQIKFVTRQGSNEFHGGLYWYHRNPWLNSNYWFNNRDLPPDPKTGKAPRARVLFNQYGFRAGGPVMIPGLLDGRNRAFFFVNYEEFRQPTQVNRQRTIFNPLTQTGVFQYNVTVGGQTEVRQVNLLTLAASRGQTSTLDPTIQKLLSEMRSAASTTGGISQMTDPNLQQWSYSPTGMGLTYRPTVRFDLTLSDKHRMEVTWTYHIGRGKPDFLNGFEPRFPGFPNQGSQPADRYTGSIGLRSTLSPRIVNEFRAGLSLGPSRFNPEASAATFSGPVANQDGFALGISAAGIVNAHSVTAPTRRNPAMRDISNSVTWTRGAHSLSFGGKFTWVTLTYNAQTLVPSIVFSTHSTDPANAMFVTANFPGAASADLTRAANIYAVLTGRVTAINANARLIEETGQYKYLGNAFERSRQKELGLFVQDSWRVRPGLTLNYGLRWEVQGPFHPLNSSYTTASLEDVWGVSGYGNLFKPGVMTGRVTQFVQFKKGVGGNETGLGNLAPSFGFAWSPNPKGGLLKKILGGGGMTVIRGAYSIAYSRRGIGDFRGTFSANPGVIITTNRDMTVGNLVGGALGSLPLLFREKDRLGPPAFDLEPKYPLTGAVTASVNRYDPNLKVPYVQSWTFGIQRELTRNIALEVRYVGTRHLRGWTTYNYNEVEHNILENGLFEEFKLAQANLRANIAAGRGNTFRYFGPGTGTSPLPIALAYFSGVPASQAGDSARYTSTNFTSTTWVNQLALYNPAPLTYAANLHSDATRRTNALNAGLPANFMMTNPDLRGGANLVSNGGYTRYDSMQVELRRRMSKGLLVQSSYVFSKGFSSSRISFRAPRINTLASGTDSSLKHALKVNWIFELPIGQGQPFFAGAGRLLNYFIGGWEFGGAGRIQSGSIQDFGNVNLAGMTEKEFRKLYGLHFDDTNKVIYHLPKDIVDNTIRAFAVSATSATGYGASGPPTGRYIAPANSPTCIQVIGNECARTNLFVTTPRFTRFDLSLVKKARITETVSFELRAEFLNAFNHTNFYTHLNMTNFTSATFGQVTSAYSDSANTNDPGGRLGQIVVRINW